MRQFWPNYIDARSMFSRLPVALKLRRISRHLSLEVREIVHLSVSNHARSLVTAGHPDVKCFHAYLLHKKIQRPTV